MFSVAIIDDNRAMVEMLAATVPWSNINCALCGTAYDGIRGLELLRTQKPDIVIADIQMPGCNGLDMIESILQGLPDAVVIFISAYSDFRYAQKALRLRAFEYLLKPFEIDDLLSCIERATSLRQPPEDVAEVTDARSLMVRSILKYIDEHPEHPTLQEISEEFGLSASYLSTLVKKETGENYIEWILRSRVKKAKKMLKDPRYSIEQVATAIGYKNYMSFYRMFVGNVGMSPSDYRNGGEAP